MRHNAYIWINHSARKILVLDTPEVPVDFSLFAKYRDLSDMGWGEAGYVADNLKAFSGYDVEYESRFIDSLLS